MFGSVLSYITLRMLGEEGNSVAEDMAVVKGRKWILDHGGAVGIPSWGKFWLTVCIHEKLTYKLCVITSSVQYSPISVYICRSLLLPKRRCFQS